MENTLSIEDFSYELPENLIAQEPSQIRHESRLLKLDRANQSVSHHVFKDIVALLKPDDILVVNDTRVIPARFFASRKTGGLVQILLVIPEATKPGLWQAMASPIKRLQAGEILTTCGTKRNYEVKVVDIISGANAQKRLIVDLGSQQNTFALLKEIGFAPLPPYIRREQPTVDLNDDALSGEYSASLKDGAAQADEGRRLADIERYQTVFALKPGAVAAPTAGLHFSPECLSDLQDKGIEVCKLTLHVGPGTFKPIGDSIDSHEIEAESFWISQETANQINQAKQQGRRVIAVGTTSCRALESSFKNGAVQPAYGQETTLYIKPGFKFNVIDGLITNFHLSKSSLLVLVAAFGGRGAIMNAYQTAIAEKYRFYSYGDAMLIL